MWVRSKRVALADPKNLTDANMRSAETHQPTL